MTDAALRRRVESDGPEGLFIGEGMYVIQRLLESRRRCRSILLTPKRLSNLGAALDAVEVPVYVAERAVLEAVCGYDVHRGALAAGLRWAPPSLASLIEGARLVAVLDGLTDNENVGAIFRSASALGVDAVLLSPGCADPLYRRSVRVSMGEVLVLPWRRAAQWPGELAQLEAAGFLVAALTPDAGAVAVDQFSSGGQPLALILGEEGPGVSAAGLGAAAVRLRIPMRPGVDSLNVGAAAAIAFHRVGAALSHPEP